MIDSITAKKLIEQIQEILDDDDLSNVQKCQMIQAELDDAMFGGFDDDDT